MFWCGIPQLLCIPPPSSQDSEPRVDDLVARLRESLSECLPDDERAKGLASIDRLELLMRDGRIGGAVAVAWNLAQKVGFLYGHSQRSAGHHEGGDERRQAERALRAKGGGRRPGAGRKVGSTDAEIRAAFEVTNPNLNKPGRCRKAIRDARLVTSGGKPLAIKTMMNRLR